MSEHLAGLLALASSAISGAPEPSALDSLTHLKSGLLTKEIAALLSDKNGFYAFESALLVRPLDHGGRPLGLLQWNERSLWQAAYQIDLRQALFFAEDVFGIQFCLKDDAVFAFDPETGRFTALSQTVEGWAAWLLENHRLRTGWPLAHQWQVQHGPLQPGMRLLPKIPFVCGGQFAIENLYTLEDLEGMRFRASLANQLVNVPDGTNIVFKIERKK